MKANKAKTSKKAVKKVSKRAVKKELEASIADKFMEALKGLGHDAEKLTKEIKKTSRVLAKKLSDKYQEVKTAVEEKLESNKKPKAGKPKKPLTSAKGAGPAAVIKAEKVVAKATTRVNASGRKAAAEPKAVSSTLVARKRAKPAASAAKPAPKAASPTKASPTRSVTSKTTASKTTAAAKPAAVKKAGASRSGGTTASGSSGGKRTSARPKTNL